MTQAPLDPSKKTTQVNLSMVAWIFLFFGILGGVLFWIMRDPQKAVEDTRERVEQKP